jgi:hypothetical protein
MKDLLVNLAFATPIAIVLALLMCALAGYQPFIQ